MHQRRTAQPFSVLSSLAPLALALLAAGPPRAHAAFLVIDTTVQQPSYTLAAGDNLQITASGDLDTGSFGSVRAVTLLGLALNDGRLRVGFSSESGGLQIANELHNRGLPGLPARIEAAQGAVGPAGWLRNEGLLLTGAYSISGVPLHAVGFGGFQIAGLAENLAPGEWINHGPLSVTGGLINAGRFESRNAPSASPASLPYLQALAVGNRNGAWPGARIENLAGASFILQQGSRLDIGGVFDNAGTVTLNTGASLVVDSTWSDSSFTGARYRQTGITGITEIAGGTLRIAGTGVLDNGGTLALRAGDVDNQRRVTSGTGAVIEVHPGAVWAQSTGAQLDSAGTLWVGGQLTGGELASAGRLVVEAGGTVQTSSVFISGGHVTVNGELGVDGSNPVGGVFMDGGLLDGSGRINGDLFLAGSGPAFGSGPCSGAPAGIACFTPGNSPGTMTIDGLLTLGEGAVLELEITRDGQGLLAFDTVSATGMRFETGSLVRLLLSPSIGESFASLQLLSCTSLSLGCQFDGEFEIVGGTASLLLDATGLSVQAVTAVPEPPPALMLLAGLAGLVGWTRRRLHAGG